MSDELVFRPASSIETKPPPRCATCFTPMWYRGSRLKWGCPVCLRLSSPRTPASELGWTKDGVPVLALSRRRDGWGTKCPRCKRWHSHSEEEGFRHAHCGDGGYGETGYVLLYAARFENDWVHIDGTGWRVEELEAELVDEWIEQETRHSLLAAAEEHEPKERSVRPYVRLYKDGDRTAVQTNVETEAEFFNHFNSALADLIDRNNFAGDWKFQLGRWLPQAFEIVAKLRGYKSNVTEERVLSAGLLALDGIHLVNDTSANEEIEATAQESASA